MSGIEWVMLDIDQTLCDFVAMRTRALHHARSRIRQVVGDGPALPTVHQLQAERDGIARRSPADRSMEQIRHAAFARVLARSGLDGADLRAAADQVTSAYLERRHGQPVLFPDVRSTLERVAQHHRLGAVSNGNSYPERLGLGDLLGVVVLAQEVGARKPERAIFDAAAAAVDAAPDELVMVGDSLEEDVHGARAAGWHAVWLDRVGEDAELAPASVPTIDSLAELPDVLDRL